jgi:raffinose/stachyose/melibiose transport system substrate-binding protein
VKTVLRPRGTRAGHATAAAACSLLTLLAACSGDSSAGGKSNAQDADSAKELSILVSSTNTTVPQLLQELQSNQCKAEGKALPLKVAQTPSDALQQKIQLLAGQEALPVMFSAGNSFISKGGSLEQADQVVGLEDAFSKLGVADQVTDGAKSVEDRLFGWMVSVPFQYNVEGIFYNKKIFADNGIDVPTTWDQLVAAAAKLKAAGIAPITASGKTGWPVSRWVGAYLLRDLGPDALQKVKDGQAKLTDPEYVRAAQAIADLGKAGYFSKGITSLDQDSSYAELLNGKAAMMYMGTWFLANINDPEQNKVGDAIGFMPFPAVANGQGSIDQYPANVGSPVSVSASAYGPKVGAWLKCIAENYGAVAMEKDGIFSGFKVNKDIPDVPPLTQDIQERINSSHSNVLWFEALFNQKATSDASANAAPLVTGQMSAEKFMQTLQTDLETAS